MIRSNWGRAFALRLLEHVRARVVQFQARDRLSSAEACRKLVRRALENFRLPYITVTSPSPSAPLIANRSANMPSYYCLPGLDQQSHLACRSSRAYANAILRDPSLVGFSDPSAQPYVAGLPQDQALIFRLLPVGQSGPVWPALRDGFTSASPIPHR